MMRAAFVPPAPAPAPPPPGRATTHRTRLPGTVAGVLAAHAAALWAVHGAWSARSPSPPAPTVVQATLLPASSAAAPAPPAASVEAPSPPQGQRPRPLAVAKRPPSAPAPAPSAMPAPNAPPPSVVPAASPPGPADPAPAAAAALSSVAPLPSAGSASTAPATDGSTATAAAAPARIDLPSASAAYLSNPPPPYPPLSRRLGEQGKVVVRVRIEADGTASAAEVRTSSGFERLDQAALQTVLRWKYVPGKRNGVPEAMWYLIPIQFVLE
ncbi:energy transducer TonB [Tepidimonas sp.]|uniref:energy transducer TonB n=1 Tax=Tepidimonas sp. TaxID=2002775 RepID=UPI003919CF8D